ncbi:unnamed protein product [Leuciscus chuanchicus]
MFTKGKGKRRFPAVNLVPAKRPKPVEVAFHLLPKQYEKTPKEQDQLVHLQAGLGRRTVYLDESTTHDELCETLKGVFPQLEAVTGGWMIYKAAGGWGSRKLSLVAPDHTGYTGKIVKAASQGGKSPLYIAPIQDELNTTPLQLSNEIFSDMPKAMCQKCGAAIPLQLLMEHLKSCNIIDVDNDEDNLDNVEDNSEQAPAQEPCPICMEMFTADFIEAHAASCGESDGMYEVLDRSTVEEQAAMPGPSSSEKVTDEWLTVQDPTKAMSLFRDSILSHHERQNPLLLSMDIRKSPAEQDAALICFYKKPNVEWARPLNCRLEGDAAIGEGVSRFFLSTCMNKLKSGFCFNFANTAVTHLFDGQPGHLVPSASQFLVESDMFAMAGRMVGHSFVHGGPCLSGLSPAVVHVLFGGSPETATVTPEDCPDLDIRETIRLLEGESELSDKDKTSVQELAYAWDLPGLNGNNRRWLFEKMLIHAVIGRVTRQIKQFRRGLKETPIWTLLTKRPDTVAQLFPQERAVDCNPAIIMQHITWPHEEDDDDDDDDYSLDTKCRISGYLRHFIENASPDELTDLLKFWTGWEIMPRNNLSIEVVKGSFPTASTCFETLRIPGHYKDYASFKNDILACIGTCQTGFGLV